MLSAIALADGETAAVPPAPPPPTPTPAPPPPPPTQAAAAATPAQPSANIPLAPPNAATLAAAGITLQQFLDAQASGIGAGAGTQALLAGDTMQQAVETAATVTQQVGIETGADDGSGGDTRSLSGVEETELQAYKPPGIVAQWRNLIDVFKVTAPSRRQTISAMFDSPKEFWK